MYDREGDLIKMSLLPKTDDKRFKLELLYMVRCPVICFVGYEDDQTQKMKDTYDMEAKLNITKTFETEIAPDYHLMTYLSQATQVAKPDPTFGNIYLSMGQKYWGVEKLDIGKLIILTEQEQEQKDRFGNWIFKKQIEYLKQKIKET